MTFPPALTTTRDGFASIVIGWSGPGTFIDRSAMIMILRGWEWLRGVQEPGYVRDEERRVLILRSVIGVRIEDELGVGQILLKNERVHGVDDHVGAAVDHQGRLGDLSEIVKGVWARRAPLADSFELRGRDRLAGLRIAIVLAQAEPLQKRPA